MLTIRRAEDRGLVNIDWLHSRHTFSFANYHDSKFMGFGPLRVINEDRVQPNKGFATHSHEDMEIISYVLDGAMEHKDSMGHGGIIRPGDVQRMSAGTGIRHSEFNHSNSDVVHFLQIWILPNKQGLEPSYEQTTFSQDDKRGQLRLVGSRDGRAGSVTIHQDVDLFAAVITENQAVTHKLAAGRNAWLQVARGSLTLGEEKLEVGDGVAIEGPHAIELSSVFDAEVLLFDMGAGK